ncbi:hypothetical protein FRC00_011477 [Tulasnella sp. 408]|nr:hypothetical protein FRC00_011477 [Tulasnella sp. 408]
MSLHPEYQAKARAEIDRIVGPDRLPSVDDRGTNKMPYLEAVVLEAMRYMSRDPAYYTNASDFNPERFLIVDEKASSVRFNKATLDPCEYVFGFGRRICPGLDMTVQELWIAMAFVLWAFEIKKKGEENWDTDEERFTFAFTSQTKPFECEFIPRSDKVKELINSAYSAIPHVRGR